MCGIFGIFGHAEAANLTYLGLHALQHRGQESAGIVTSDGERLHTHRAMGHAADIFTEDVLSRLPGKMAIGHVRYSTTGNSSLHNAQPFSIATRWGGLAIAHNGNLVNTDTLRERLEQHGALFQTTLDTEVIIHLIAHSRRPTIEERIAEALKQVRGAYSLLFATADKLIAVRDPHGFRPLVLGKLKRAHVIASETCAFDLIDATPLREIEPGEMVTIDAAGMHTRKIAEPDRPARCIFEYVYFARPDSSIFGMGVLGARRRMGQQLAREQPAEADIVIPVPDSGIHAAMGYADESNTRFEMGFVRSHYVGRTFIEPQQSIRNFGVKLKLNPVREIIAGKRVVVIDDSIVRGTTSRKIVRLLRDAGAREVHVRISSPPTTHSCFYGIDTPTPAELIAHNLGVEEICKFLGADSLGYLSVEGMHKAVAGDKAVSGDGYCNACFTGKYPVAIERAGGDRQLKLGGVE